MKRIAAVVVTYNRKALLLENIKSLLHQTVADQLDIIIVDNASIDGTQEALADYISEGKIVYKNTGANLGGAGGFSYGVKAAVEAGYEYLWLMDDDTIPQADALEILINAKNKLKGQFGFLSGNVLWKDGSPCLMNKQKYYNTVVDIKNSKNEFVPVTQATFVSLFVSAVVVKKVGLPIKEFFIWGDDVEFTRRISIIHQYPCYCVKYSIVNHLMNENTGSNIAIDVPERIERYRYAYRNEFYTYKQVGMKGLFYYFAKCGFNLLRIIVKGKDNRIKRVKVLLNAITEGVWFNPDIERVERISTCCTPPPRLVFLPKRRMALAI